MKASVQNVSPSALRRALRLVALTLLAALLGSMFGAGAAFAQVNAYVASAGDNRVLVIDTATNTVTATVSVTGARTITLSPDGRYVYASTSTGYSVIDRATNQIVSSATTGTNPVGIVLSPNGSVAYVANGGSGTVSVVDTATNLVTATLPIAPAGGIAITPNGTSVWVAESAVGGANIKVIDTATNTITSFPAGHGDTGPSSIAFVPGGAEALQANPDDNTVSLVTATHVEEAAIPVGSSPFYVAADPNNGFAAYAVNLLGNSVTVLDLGFGIAGPTAPVGSQPRALALTPDSAFAYVTNSGSNTITVLDTSDSLNALPVIATFSAGSQPWGIAISSQANGPVVLTYNQASVTVNAGQTATNTGTVSDANHNAVTLTASVGSVVNNGDGTWSWSFATSNATPSQTVTITGDDGHGSTSSVKFSLVVNQAPQLVLTSDQASVTVNEGQVANNTGTVSDTNNFTVALTASVGTVINNGNGTWSWSFLTSDGPTQSQTVTITGNDGHGGVSTTTFALVVLNVPPTIVSVTNNGPVIAGHSATITVTATDPAGANDPLTYSFDCDNNGTFEIGPQSGNSAACTFATAGSHTVNVRVADDDGGVTTGSTVVTVIFPPPSCASATASPNLLWPPNHKFVAITISGIVNPAPGAVTITVTSIFQDEPVQSPGSGNTSPDATGVGTSTPSVRSERDGNGDGRVYHINFTATGASGSCTGSVTVGVPHDQGHGGPVDEGPLYNSTLP